MSDPLASLVKKIDEAVNASSGKHPRKLGTFLIIGDAPGRAEQLQRLAAEKKLGRVTLCVGVAPPRYEVNKDADLTIVIYNPDRPGRQTVQANFALRPGQLDEARTDAILAALVKAMPK